MNPLHPKKLLLTKWTALQPVSKNKHFLVTKVIAPLPPDTPIKWLEMEAVYSKTTKIIDWRELKDITQWRQGWV
ncbi:TIGR02450 family Trp-rich protein [Pusillimonas minor]|uniref:TIGR02450 family Trp-rich protein n=1 Tax=Pusillimonas minor TaxID=2697024 RepID=A0A842HLG9_9BURK|nr:TIGR02450 family Trp-rich protein [Pusillimonas minor]MBC2768368.1 TIGR02450 family Trp-rich protein [Pusillimonas minor]